MDIPAYGALAATNGNTNHDVVLGRGLMIDREYFTVVFKGDIGKFKTNPLHMKTAFGEVVAAGRGNAFEEAEVLRELCDGNPQRECQ